MFSSSTSAGPYSWMNSSSTCSRMVSEFFFWGEVHCGNRPATLAPLPVVRLVAARLAAGSGTGPPVVLGGAACAVTVAAGAPAAAMERMAEREPLVRPVSARAKPVWLAWLLLGSAAAAAAVGVVVLRWRALSEVVCQRPTGLPWGAGAQVPCWSGHTGKQGTAMTRSSTSAPPSDSSAGPTLGGALALLVLSVVALVWPASVAWPFAVLFAWFGLNLAIRAWRLRKRQQRNAQPFEEEP
ncbi:MAG: hypothetical protein WDW36_005730 [Sanguina aurantia]